MAQPSLSPIEQIRGLATAYSNYAQNLHRQLSTPTDPEQDMGYPILLSLDEQTIDLAFTLPRRTTQSLDEDTIKAMRDDTKALGGYLRHRRPHPGVFRHPVNALRGHFATLISPKGARDVMLEDLEGVSGIRPSAVQRGWMLDYLAFYDPTGRWIWWHSAYRHQRFDNPIPYVAFEESHPVAQGIIDNTLDYIVGDAWLTVADKWQAVEYLLDWLLWSLGHPLQPQVPHDPWSQEKRTFDWVYQLFDTQSLLLMPGDHLGEMIRRAAADGSRRMPSSHLSQPAANRLAKRLFPNRRTDYRDRLLVDVQASSGTLLLAASNFTTKLAATNLDPLLAKAAIINSYFYAPWMVLPFSWLPTETDVDWQEALGRTNEAMKVRQVPRRYFSDTIANGEARFLPIEMRVPRSPAPESSTMAPAPIRKLPQQPHPARTKPSQQQIGPSRRRIGPSRRQLPGAMD